MRVSEKANLLHPYTRLIWVWRDGTEVKGTKFDSQYPHGRLGSSTTPVPGNSATQKLASVGIRTTCVAQAKLPYT